MGEILDMATGELVGRQHAEHWADLVWKDWRQSVEGILAAGQHLVEAKDALEHGEWGKLTGETTGEGMLPFSARTAQMLMNVANDARLLNPNHGSDLPNSWRTLYELTHLTDSEFDKGIETGVINPEMERKDVAMLQLGKGKPFVTQWSGNNEWYTPELYIKAAKKVMGGIDLDPASCEYAQKIIKARKWYSEDDDGLQYPWTGRIWLNPPYKTPAPFVDKLIEASKTGAQGILLTNNNTDTVWWHDAVNASTGVCFTRGRISFYNKAGEASSPTNGQTFFYFGKQGNVFSEIFGEFGFVLELK